MCPKDHYISQVLSRVGGTKGKINDQAVNSLGMMCRPMVGKGDYSKSTVKVVSGSGPGGYWRGMSKEIYGGYLCGGWAGSVRNTKGGSTFRGMFVNLCALYK